MQEKSLPSFHEDTKRRKRRGRWEGVEGLPCGADTKVHEGARREKDCQCEEPQIAQIRADFWAGYRRQDCQNGLEITKDTVQARSDKPSTAKDTKGILAD